MASTSPSLAININFSLGQIPPCAILENVRAPILPSPSWLKAMCAQNGGSPTVTLGSRDASITQSGILFVLDLLSGLTLLVGSFALHACTHPFGCVLWGVIFFTSDVTKYDTHMKTSRISTTRAKQHKPVHSKSLAKFHCETNDETMGRY